MPRAGHPLGMTGPFFFVRYCEEAAVLFAAGVRTLFLLPGGRPRRLGAISDIQFGGRPGPRPRPRARRSRLTIASSICSRSAFSSARILLTSITIFLLPTPALSRSLNYDGNRASLPNTLSRVYRNLADLQGLNLKVRLEFRYIY